MQPLTADFGAALQMLLYTLLGALAGVVAAGFIRGLHIAEDAFDRIANRYLRHMLGMALVGLLMVALFLTLGQYFVDGVGYGTIESILLGHATAFGLISLLLVCKLVATCASLGSGSSGGIFSPSLFMGAALGAAFAAGLNALGIPVHLNVPAFAMVGMGAMVGGGTGAVMTAVTMTFEMTRDYDIVMPMILAVASSVGVRRLLSRENIYTLKLVRRGRAIPKARHANMFLVRLAREVMDADVLVLDGECSFDAFLREHEAEGKLKHVVVARGDKLCGVIRINTGLRRGLESTATGVTLADVANRNFPIVTENTVAYDVIDRMWRKQAIMAVVIGANGAPTADNVRGVITKDMSPIPLLTA